MHAGACAAAWLGGAATSAANAYNSWLSLQLPGRDGSRKENSRHQHAQERCLDFASHDRTSFPKLLSRFFRLRPDRAGVSDAASGSAEHLADARAGTGLGRAARSLAGQDVGLLLQLHGGSGAGAENTQDQRGKKRRFGFLIHVRLPSSFRGQKRASYRAGLAAMKLHVPLVNPG